MAGTRVESIVITNGGAGYTSSPTVTIAGNAVATAKVYAGSIIPASFVRSRFNDLYVFDGMGRGLRWDGAASAMQPIGLQKPQTGPTVTITNASMSGYVDAVNVVAVGAGYAQPPSVTFSGGTPTTAAAGRAEIVGGRLVSVTLSETGAGYKAAPQVTIGPSNMSGATLTVGVLGSVAAVTVLSPGQNYTSTPAVVFSNDRGLINANAVAIMNGTGGVASIDLLSGGTGATTAVTATLYGGGGSGVALQVGMRYSVTAVNVVSGGTGFVVPPAISLQASSADAYASLGAVTSSVAAGKITAVTVTAGGAYSLPPTALLADSQATAVATISNAFRGKYKCAIRYLDNTPVQFRGPINSSISDLIEVDTGDGASQLSWSLSHAGLDDRVYAVELWRTTSDQSVLLFRVATLLRSGNNFSGPYTDTLSDKDLSDIERDGYGLLPVTLPSGQLNARRFGVPPGNFAVACMFQDRCWLAVDTTGDKPNSMYFSEVDEPESIPAENEIVVQENAGDSDAIVGLVPLGSYLLAAQSRHLYKLTYVAQPVLDASIMLVAYRGLLNSRCWDVMGGTAFIADSYGLYAYDGQADTPISVPVDDYWRDGTIDFSKASKFFVRADVATKVIRFFYCTTADTDPKRALCYCLTTKTWWEERFAYPVTAAAPYAVNGQQGVAYAISSGGAQAAFATFSGYQDFNQSIPYSLRTGNMELVQEESRQNVSLLYTPTAGDSLLSLARHFNGSDTPRLNVISSDRGDGFISTAGTVNTLNMKKTRSALGDASGVARAMFSGSNEERSVGGDRHVAIALAGTQSASTNAPTLHAVMIEGAK